MAAKAKAKTKKARKFSGEFVVRITPALHAAMAKSAEVNERSLNGEACVAFQRHVMTEHKRGVL